MVRRRLPIGIQTFREIREEGYYYVDKTAYARRLADDAGKHYFLSRPRRFGGSAPVRCRRLIEALSERAGCRAVVLVDEYDKPILDVLDDPEQAKANRDDLRGLYGTLKASDAHVELTFITGVSKFSR